jgi:uncharacterized membrane protein YqjE
MTVQIVSRIVKHVQTHLHVPLVNLQPHKINNEFYLFVIVLRAPTLLPILIVLIVWQIVPHVVTEFNA